MYPSCYPTLPKSNVLYDDEVQHEVKGVTRTDIYFKIVHSGITSGECLEEFFLVISTGIKLICSSCVGAPFG